MGILTRDQRKQWKTDGYLVLKGVLSPDEVQALLATVDTMDSEFRKGENVTADSVFDKRNVMEDDDIFVDLMDHRVTFPIVRELMGDFIQLSMSEVIVRPPNPKDPRVSTHGRGASDADDSGQPIEFTAAGQNPLLLDGS